MTSSTDEAMEEEDVYAQRQREAAVVAHKDGRSAFWKGARPRGLPCSLDVLIPVGIVGWPAARHSFSVVGSSVCCLGRPVLTECGQERECAQGTSGRP